MPTTIDIESQRMLLGTTPVRKIYQGTNLLGTRIAELFANGKQGVWYDPSDLSTLFQDSAGTLPVTAIEQPVGLMLDKSGRGNHAVQATTTARPILQQDANGRLYLAFDGVDDYMVTSNNLPQFGAVTVIVGAQKGATSRGMVVCGTGDPAGQVNAFTVELPSASGTTLLSRVRGTGASSAAYNNIPTDHLTVATASLSATPILNALRNNGALFATNSTTAPGDGPISTGKLAIGGTPLGTVVFTGRIYGIVGVAQILDNARLNAVEQYMRNKTKAY